MSLNESYPQQVVTAVIVAHDGVAWLPQLADALLDQTRPVQRVVAVDTGSRDRSGSVLASKFGHAPVFGMDRSTGYGAAIARALTHRAANTPVPGAGGGPPGERVEWLWLLHDDCEPAHDALEQLLRGAAETPSAAVLGPKLRDWSNREVIVEAGVTLDTAARRVTGIEPREVDQGQHDGDRDTLAVSSAGMLVRRDVWEQVGGFDTGMGLFMEDVDFCWRAHAAGYRVRVITDAVVYHVRAATKHRRAISVGRRAGMLDRRNGLLTLLGNLPASQMLTSVAGNVAVSTLRILFFLLAKRLAAAMDEATALAAVLMHPFRLIRMRGQRARGRRAAYSRVRADLPPGHSVRRVFEFGAAALMKGQPDTTGSHHASVDPTDDDSLLEDNGLARRLLTSPTLLTFVILLAVTLVAARSLLTAGPLGGGSLVPAWGGASDLWRTYVQAFHPVGVGSDATAPSWLAVIAILATLLAGKAWLAIDVILIGCVPLAGMTAMLAVRRVTSSAPVRVWASITYALLPVAMGVISGGRFGSAVVFVLLPLIALSAGRIFTGTRKQAGRAAWATGLLVAVAAAFVPLLWPVVVAGCVLAAIVFRMSRPGLLRNLAIVALTTPVLLMPWTVTLLSRPSDLLLEAGLPQQGTPVTGLPARALMLLSPGGPGLPPYWVTGGLVAAALIALFATRRRAVVIAGWGLALSGLLIAVIASHLTVRPPDGGPVVVWAGLPLALAAIGMLLAASAGADAFLGTTGQRKGLRAVPGGRRMWVALLGIIACATPLVAAGWWLETGVGGPVHPVSSTLVPELVAVADGQGNQVRTLVLRETGGHLSYLLLRGPSPSMADASMTPPPAAQQALSRIVAALTAPDGSMAVDQARQLAQFDIGYVLVEAPVDQQIVGVLNDTTGLRLYSTRSNYTLWQLTTAPARVSVLERNGTVVPIASGPVGVSGARLPAAGGTLMLAEPAGAWSASVNGQRLTQVKSPAGSWAEAFRLPSGGGTLTIGYPGLDHDLLLLLELVAFVVVAALALPGIHMAEPEGGHAAPDAGAERDREPALAGARAASGGTAAAEPAGHRSHRAGARRGGASGYGDDPRGANGYDDPRGATEYDDDLRSAGGYDDEMRAPGGYDDLRGDDLADDYLTGADLAGDDRLARRDRVSPGPQASAVARRGSLAGLAGFAGHSARSARGARGRTGRSGRADADLPVRDQAAARGPERGAGAGGDRVSERGAWPERGLAPEPDPGSERGLASERGAMARRSPWPGRSGRSQDDPRPERDSGLPGDAGPQRGPRPERGAVSGRGTSGDPDSRLPDAWPYAGRAQENQARAADPWAYQDRDDSATRGRGGDLADRPERSRSYPRDPDPPIGQRSPSGTWPYPDDRAPASREYETGPGARPASRPDSGGWSYPGSVRGGGTDEPRGTGWDAQDDRRRRDADQGRSGGWSDRRTGEPDRGWPASQSGGPDRRGGAPGRDRWGEQSRDGRQSAPMGSQAESWRAADQPGGWAGGGDDALEPLPPLDGPARSGSRRSAWRPTDDDTGDWDGRDDTPASQRWSAPQSQYEPDYEAGYSADYEGDAW